MSILAQPAASWTAGAVFQLLRDGAEPTRAEIAAQTGLARSTVALRLDELTTAGLVRAATTAPSTGGRPPARIALDPSAHLVAGVDLGAWHVAVGVADLSGTVLGSTRRAASIARGPAATLAEAIEALDEVLAELGRSRTDVLAVGVGLPGPVEHDSGRARRPPIMPGWDGFDVPGWFRASAGLAALVDNDVNLMAVGERHAAWRDVENLVFVKASTGIGAGIVSGGRLQRGALGAAGDLGHVAVPGADAVRCSCGNTGCLEAVAGMPALLAGLGGRASDGAQIVELVRGQDAPAVAVVREAGRNIGAVLASVVSLLNPSVVVLGGRLADAGEPLLAGIREIVYGRATPLATEHLAIVASRAGDRAGVLGATRLALDEALAAASVDALLAG